MKNIVVFGGTREGRLISQGLSDIDIYHVLSVATDFGKEVISPNPYVKIMVGRKNKDDIKELFRELNTKITVDATHPYAKEASINIRGAAKELGVTYLRLERDTNLPTELMEYKNIMCFETPEACADYLITQEGNCLLTTGSKSLPVFCRRGSLKERLYARVIPAVESLDICTGEGMAPGHILGIQGPFSKELNLAFIREYDIKFLVTKNSGKTGGTPEKIEAAREAGITVCLIGDGHE